MGWLTKYGDRQPLLSASEELELGAIVRRWHDHPAPVPSALERAGRKARDRFVAANIRLVYHVLQRYTTMVRGCEDDVVQAGMLGLLRAVERFDPTKGYRFSTYAYWWIRQGIQRFINTEMHLLRLPSGFYERQQKLLPIERALRQRLGRVPSDAELARETRWEESAIAALRRPPTCNQSLDATVNGTDDLLLLDTLQAEQPDDDSLIVDAVMRAMATLPEPQQQVLHALYLGEAKVLNTTLAKQMGVGRNVIANLHNAAVSTLQELLNARRQQTTEQQQEPVWRQLLTDVLMDGEPDDSRIPELMQAVATLPSNYQQVLRAWYSPSNNEAWRIDLARRLGIQPQTVGYFKRRAIKLLQKRMLDAAASINWRQLLLAVLMDSNSDDDQIPKLMQAVATLPNNQQLVLRAFYRVSKPETWQADLTEQLQVSYRVAMEYKRRAICQLRKQMQSSAQEPVWRQLLAAVLMEDNPDEGRIPDLMQAIVKLPYKHEQVLRAFYSASKTEDWQVDLAKHLEIRPGTLPSLRKRAIERLRKYVLGADMARQEAA